MNRAGRHYFWIFLISSTLYFVAGLINSLPFQQSRIVDISTQLDGYYFNANAVWIYSLYYLLMIYPILGRQSYEASVQLGRSILAFSVFAFFIFLLMPVQIFRPSDSILGSGLSSDALRFIYTIDEPYNCFPSLHVLHSWIIAIHFSRQKQEWAIIRFSLLLAAAGVTFSTVIVRQHYVLDVVSSLVLASVWFLLSNLDKPQPKVFKTGAMAR